MASSHYNIATEGIRAGHKAQATLGFGHFVQIIVREQPSSGGGGGSPHVPERRYEDRNPLFSLIWIEFYGKEVNFPFYNIYRDKRIEIEVNLFSYTIDRDTDTIIDVKLVSSKKQIIEPPIITIKENTNDSIERIEQPRILVEYPKLIKPT